MRIQTEWYRKHRNTLLKDGRGLTMGALYWQLNDVWQAPTWSSIGNTIILKLFVLIKINLHTHRCKTKNAQIN